MSDSPSRELGKELVILLDRMNGLIGRSYAHSRGVRGDDAAEGAYLRGLFKAVEALGQDFESYIQRRIEAATKSKPGGK